MAKKLHLNTNKIWRDYVQAMVDCIDDLLDYFYRSVEGGLRGGAKGDLKVEELDNLEKGLLCRKLIAGPLAVMDSWGTGDKMDADNPALPSYFDSEMYNPLREQRPQAPIVGRPAGPYIDIFGERQVSSGRLAGIPLEGFLDSPVMSREPSGAFQNTYKWFKTEGTVKKAIDKTNEQFFEHVANNSSTYFSFY